MRAPDTDPTETTADADLVLRSRSGDADAFGELWRRHYGSAIVAARSISPSFDADDLVQESYAKIFQAIRRGGGPTGSFRAYLFTAIRNTAAAWGGARRETAVDELDDVEDPATSEEAVDAALDRSLTTTAFRSLPSRWQEVLWYTEVEQMKPAAVAGLLGMKPAAVSQLAFRAREGLREAWIQAHIAAVGEDSECRWTIERLGAHSRGNLGSRDRGKVDRHLAECARCAIVAAEARDVGSRLVLVLLPLAVGVTGAAGYLASLQQNGSAPMALMAMPEGVLDGAVTGGAEIVGQGAEVFGHVAEGAGALLGAASTAAAGVGAAGSSSGSSGAAAGGSAWTIGGLVVAGAASIAIVGTIVAAAVLPGTPAPTSNPAASEESAAPSDASIEPDAALAAHGSDEPEKAEEPPAPDPEPEPDKPEPPAPTPPAPEPVQPAPEPVTDAAIPAADEAAPPQPANPVEPTPTPTPTTPTTPPVDDPEDPGEDPGSEQPGTGDPDPDPGTEIPDPEPAPDLAIDPAASGWDASQVTVTVQNATPDETVTVRVYRGISFDIADGSAIAGPDGRVSFAVEPRSGRGFDEYDVVVIKTSDGESVPPFRLGSLS